MATQKGFIPLLVIILIAVVSIGGYFAYQQVNKTPSTPPPDQVACTQDAKLCPDGTSVGRVGPNCEFSPCATPKESTNSAFQVQTDKALPPLFPGIKWEYANKGKFLFRTTDGTIIEREGYQIESEILKDQYAVQTDFFNYYQERLPKLGWRENKWAVADGPDGSMTGFEKAGRLINLMVQTSAGLLHKPGPRAVVTYTLP